MDWNVAIKEWEARVRNIEYPEQDITIEYNGKPLCHYNGDYKPGCIKKAMLKTFTGKGKKRIESEEIES